MNFDLDSIISRMRKARMDDHPETLLNIFNEAKDELIKNHDHQNLCLLLVSCQYKWISPQDILKAAEEAIEMAKEEGKRAMVSIYHLIAGKSAKALSYWSQEKTEENDHFKMALEDPEYLASISMDDIDWMEKGEDSVIFGNDLLSFIGIESDNYQVLYEYYKQTGNRAASCYCLIQMAAKDEGNNEEKYEKFIKIINEYNDIPVVCEAVKYICENGLLPKSYDDSITTQNEYAERKYSMLKEFVEKFPDDSHITELVSLMKEMKRPRFETSRFDETAIPGQGFSIPLTLRNINSLTVSLYPTDFTGLKVEYSKYSSMYQKLIRDHAAGEPVYSRTYEYENLVPYKTFENRIEVDGLRPGIYMVELKSDHGEAELKLLHVSNILAIAEVLPDDRVRINVVDITTGHPIPNAKVDVKRYGNSVEKTLHCNKYGEVMYKYKHDNAPSCIIPYTDDDPFCKAEDIWLRGGYSYNREKELYSIEIFTDRKIYRPGQTIHAAFVRYNTDTRKRVKTVKEKQKIQLSVRYGKTIEEATVKTDDFGVAHYDFLLPDDAETGAYTISYDGAMESIRVEEYKRPTFDVIINDYSETYKAGETISIEGCACSFAGIPISFANIKYRVKRAAAWWWRFLNPYWEVGGYYGRYGESEYYTGEAMTDEDGHFKIDVPMLLADNQYQAEKLGPVFMNIVVEADVIDSTGEMQTGRKELPLSNKEYCMSISMEENIERSVTPSFTVVLKNATGRNLSEDILYWIDDAVEKTRLAANQTISIPALEIGKHVVHVQYRDEEISHEFVLFDKDSDKIPCETEFWAYQSTKEFPENGGDVIIQIGCSETDTYILYNVFSGDKLIESGAEYAGTGMLNRHFSYRKEYGNVVLISYAWVRNKKMQTHNFTISKPIPRKKLQLSWETFRDRVTPGSKESWVLSVKDDEGRNVTANVIATLYDKSLDKLAPSMSGNYGPSLTWNVPDSEWMYDEIETIRLSYIQDFSREYAPYRFNKFKIELAVREFEEMMFRRQIEEERSRVCYSLASPVQMRYARCHEEDSIESIIQHADGNLDKSDILDFGTGEENHLPQLRSDMSETAFFMPMLRTDDDGNVKIEFTLPDSLTTWKFKAFAHTTEMYCSFFEDETIARKTVMVQPNLPRFVRVGDETTITTKVINTSEYIISGRVVLELLNAADEKLIYSDSKPLKLDGNQSCSVSFQFTPDEEIEDYICMVYAVGNNFSDGEQHSIPVLPNKTEVTVTQIISQDGEGTEEVNTEVLLPEGCSRRHLSLQYTNNPIWLAIKALPAMTDYESDNSISIAVSLYCNLLTAHLQENVKKYGTIEMPNVVTLERTTKQLVNKLCKLQGYGGGFRWYKDMPESLYMTTEILMHLCRLQKFTGDDFNKIGEIVDKAFEFCDAEMISWVKELRKREKKGEKVYMPTFTLLQHMYNCAISGRELLNEAKNSYEYLTQLLKKDILDQTMREKAMSAVILEYAGDHERAMVYVESLRQYTKLDFERGRTFDTPRATFSWYSYKIPTHVSGMEALYLLCSEDKTTLMEMQKWLLNEKRTQKWDTPIDCVNAVHALLLNADEFISDNRISKFYADGEKITVDIKGNEGYAESEIPAETKSLTIEKTSKGLSWGAVFAQFLQPISDVVSSGSGMTIQREILTDKEKLHVGDRITVRLTYTCERNFDMVTVIDSKAACMEPVHQLSWNDSFKNVSPRDKEVRYSYYGLGQGAHSIETEYYLDRPGTYEIGVATIQCTYAPEYRAVCKSQKITVLK